MLRSTDFEIKFTVVHSFVAEDERLIGAERGVPQTLRLSLVHSFGAAFHRL